MAKKTYFCHNCNSKLVKIVIDPDLVVDCPKCSLKMEVLLGSISAVVKETIDNGIQVRKTEQYANAGDLFKEHTFQHITKKKDNSL